MWRVLSPDGLIIIREPCISILRQQKSIADEDQALKAGITHYYYTYRDYVNYVSQITSELHIEGDIPIINPQRHPILNILQKPILALRKFYLFRNIISKIYLIFISGSVEIIGIKKVSLSGKTMKSRDVIPIDIRAFNTQQIEFYRTELNPKILKIFLEQYKE